MLEISDADLIALSKRFDVNGLVVVLVRGDMVAVESTSVAGTVGQRIVNQIRDIVLRHPSMIIDAEIQRFVREPDES